MKIAYYGKNDQQTYYINSIKHGFKPCENFQEMVEEAYDLRRNGFLLALENRKNLTVGELQTVREKL